MSRFIASIALVLLLSGCSSVEPIGPEPTAKPFDSIVEMKSDIEDLGINCNKWTLLPPMGVVEESATCRNSNMFFLYPDGTDMDAEAKAIHFRIADKSKLPQGLRNVRSVVYGPNWIVCTDADTAETIATGLHARTITWRE
jgi:hypothetical protein